MQIFCSEDFKSQIEQYLRKNSYREIDEIVINYFFDKSFEELKSGVRLNNSDTIPFIKKRLGGSGGYRIYYLLKDAIVYLMFIYPKTGTFGASNLEDDAKTEIYKNIFEAIQKNDLYSVGQSSDKKSLLFKKTVQKV